MLQNNNHRKNNMTSDYYRDVIALRALAEAYKSSSNATERQRAMEIEQIISVANGREIALEAARRNFNSQVDVYCQAWKAPGSGPILLADALDALDRDDFPAEIKKVLDDLRESIKITGGGGGGNAAWPSNYVSSSS
jgi:hypothetical protein